MGFLGFGFLFCFFPERTLDVWGGGVSAGLRRQVMGWGGNKEVYFTSCSPR